MENYKVVMIVDVLVVWVWCDGVWGEICSGVVDFVMGVLVVDVVICFVDEFVDV